MTTLFSASGSERWAIQNPGEGTQEGFCFQKSLAFSWEAELDWVKYSLSSWSSQSHLMTMGLENKSKHLVSSLDLNKTKEAINFFEKSPPPQIPSMAFQHIFDENVNVFRYGSLDEFSLAYIQLILGNWTACTNKGLNP